MTTVKHDGEKKEVYGKRRVLSEDRLSFDGAGMTSSGVYRRQTRQYPWRGKGAKNSEGLREAHFSISYLRVRRGAVDPPLPRTGTSAESDAA
jgi:hypothetical protein